MNETSAYRIECLECGSIAWGHPEKGPEEDKEYHRDHYCDEAEFDVRPLDTTGDHDE